MSKIVLITGASSGIGKTIAIFLTNKGFKVYGTCRNPLNYPYTKFELIKSNINNSNNTLPSGSYFYIFSYLDQSSQENIIKKGVLTLINN